MPTYVYMSAKTHADISPSLVNTGPDNNFWPDFKNPASFVAKNAVDQNVLTVDRNDGIFDHTTIAELRLSIGGNFIAALEIMLSVGGGPLPIKSFICWAWRTATPETGRYETDHTAHSTTFQIGAWIYSFVVQGKGTSGFDDIYISLSSTLDRSRWMEGLAARIGTIPLNEILLPGSHDSGTSSITESSSWAPDSTWWHSFSPSAVVRWSRTQSKPIVGQLLDGIRYFDFRVAPSTAGHYALVHALEGDDLQVSFTAVRDFLATHPQEIVILDLNHFYAMEPSDHDAVVTMIRNTLGGSIVPPARGVKVIPNTLWSSAQRVIVAYADDSVVAKNPTLLWPRQNAATSTISAPYPDTNDINVLNTFLTNALTNRTFSKFFVLQGIMTPGVAQVLWPGHSLESWSRDTTNPALAGWITNAWPAKKPNIIMSDFYEQSDIVGKVIALN